MKKLFPLLLCLFVFGCKKDAPQQRQTMQFDIAGLPDTLSIAQKDTVEVPLSVTYISGAKERVTLQISGLPALAGAGFSHNLDTPAFNSVLRFICQNTALGIYDVTVTGSSTERTVSRSFKLNVIPNVINPASFLTGNYTETGSCSESGNQNNPVTVSEVLPDFNKIKFTGLWGGSQSTVIYADIDPQSHTVSIPIQTVNAASFSGNGTYTPSQIFLTYKAVNNFGTDSCNIVLNR